MTSAPQEGEPLYSTLCVHPEYCELVDLFVAEMPERIDNLLRLLDARGWMELRRAAHQLKGSAGGYGFRPISPAAARLEDALSQGLPEADIRRAVCDLIELCRRARSGSPH